MCRGRGWTRGPAGVLRCACNPKPTREQTEAMRRLHSIGASRQMTIFEELKNA